MTISEIIERELPVPRYHAQCCKCVACTKAFGRAVAKAVVEECAKIAERIAVESGDEYCDEGQEVAYSVAYEIRAVAAPDPSDGKEGGDGSV